MEKTTLGERNDLFSWSDIVRVTKTRRMRWAGHIERMMESSGYTGCWWGNLTERDHLENQVVDEKYILRRIFRKWNVESFGLDRAGAG